jgi:beta-lactamase class A
VVSRGRRGRGIFAAATGLTAACAVLTASTGSPRGGNSSAAYTTVALMAAQASTSACASPSASQRALAARLSRDIQAVLRTRSSIVALTVADRRTGVTCRLQEGRHFDSASVVKVTILGALLRTALEQHRYLTRTEVNLSTAMIEKSDNNAATALWNEVGRHRLQHFLNLAKMTETSLGPGGYWGLTQITARDELTLLRLLTSKNSVLDATSRQYALYLMAHVTSSQRWGVPAGAPAGVTVHVKNGWLPRSTYGWRIHSIGSFTGSGRDYMIVVLTQNNATMAYGVRTIEDLAEVIHRDLNSGQAAAVPASVISPSQEKPDELIPALRGVP